MELTGTIRPVRPDDLRRFLALWPRLSAETRYRRFHAPVHQLPMAAVRHLVLVDHDLREALVAVVGSEVVGVARYDRSPTDPAAAEIAVVVEDGWQGVGLGRQLLAELVALAVARGVGRLTATVQADNAPVAGLLGRLLPQATYTDDGDGVVTVRAVLPLPASPTPALVAG
jgi:GNAT superfamily N-acetyltransferase